MQHASFLPPDTRAVLDRLSRRDDIRGFTLIGGTALALRHGHRRSEDLDLAWTGGDLPTRTIRRIIDELPQTGPARNLIDPIEAQLAENEGAYLAAHQQDWSIDGVKVTFYAQPPRNAGIIDGGGTDAIGNLAVADDDTLFKLKSVVLLDRTTSRDLFDLWWFVSTQGRTTSDILKVMRDHDPHLSADMHMQKLAPAKLRAADPGFDSDLPGAPRDKDELMARMAGMVQGHRRDLARRAAMQAAAQRGGPGH